MLTNESFNALLKTLEEPPQHVIFIMATTEYHKIPETILSRCQAFPFKKFSNLELKSRLEFILKNEKIDFDDEALLPISVKGEGSMRDAISLLDRIIAYSGDKKITYELVNEVLGIVPSRMYLDFLEGIIQRDARKCLDLINALYYDGYNLKVFFFDFLDFIKNALLIKKDLYKDTGYFTSSQVNEIQDKIAGFDENEFILTFDICYKLYNNWTYYNTTNSFEILLNLEMAIIEILDKLQKPSISALLQKLSRLERAITEGKPFTDNVTASPPSSEVKPAETKALEPREPSPDTAKPFSRPAAEEEDIGMLIQKEFGAREEDDETNKGIFKG